MMVVKLPSTLGPLTAPTLIAQLRNRLPTQLRRCIPLYIVCVVCILWFNFHLFGQSGRNQDLALRSSPMFLKQPLQRPRSLFPRKIWQIWKHSPLHFDTRDADMARGWVEKNPDYRYEVLTDNNEMNYVDWWFGPEGFDRPDIVSFYNQINTLIVKADLLRYIVMYVEGGVYADIDVEALRPIHQFIPRRYDENDIDMVIGVEVDEPEWKDHPILGSKSRSFCQWTFMAKPQSPVMLRLIEQIMEWLHAVAKKQNLSISDVSLDFDEIITGTGPSAFTNAFLKEMNLLNPSGPPITWDDFHDLDESKLVSRFLVLTVAAFAAGQGHSNSGNHDTRTALVRHHYHASNWPSMHPRFKHPVYGEVERCNWNDECVRKWDEDVAAFKQLSEVEQEQMIADNEKSIIAADEEEQRKREDEARNQEEEKRRKEEQEKQIQARKKLEAEEAAKAEERRKDEEREKERKMKEDYERVTNKTNEEQKQPVKATKLDTFLSW